VPTGSSLRFRVKVWSVIVVYLGVVFLVVIAGVVAVVPHLGTASAVGLIVGCVVFFGFAIWIVSRGGGWGGWGNSGRMGN
jgi:heme A synthase